MSSTLKVVVILLSVLLTNVLGWYLKEKKGLPKSGSAFYILGNLLYGAGIFLIAQIFNVRENWPDGYMLWMLGSVLMAFALEEYSLFYLGALVGFIAVVGHPFILLDDPLSLTGFDFTPISLLVLTTIVAALTGWQVRKKVPQEQKGFF